MNIDLSNLNETQLMDLNKQVVERLRHIRQLATMRDMANFAPGDRVCFDARDGETITGIITKFNKKSVTVVTDDRHKWNVAPCFLSKVVQANARKASNVLSLSQIGEGPDGLSKNAPCPCGSGKKFKRCCLTSSY